MTVTLEEMRRFGYAPGNYSCRCNRCEREFTGDKRAAKCRDCATGLVAMSKSTNTIEQPQNEAVDVMQRIRETKLAVDMEIDATAERVMEAVKICGSITFLPQGGIPVDQVVMFVHHRVYDAIARKTKDLKDVKN